MPGSTLRPYQMQLHLTDFCNLKCIFCPTRTFIKNQNLDANKELSTTEWLDLVEQAAALGVEDFHICGGGEPFFFQSKALAVMGRIKELGKSGEIITNGTMLTPEIIIRLVEMSWDKMTFSLDGPSAKIHDAIRATPCFKRIVVNIQRITEEKTKAKVRKPQLCIHFVVCNLNYKSIPEMIPLCEQLGADTLLIQALNIWSDDIAQYKLSEKQELELQTILKEANSEAEKAGLSTNIPDFLRHDLFSKANIMDKVMTDTPLGLSFLNVPCYMPWYNLSVFADGRILPCFILKRESLSFKEHCLEDIWRSEHFESIREEMLTHRLGDDCAKCNPWSLTKTEEIRQSLLALSAEPPCTGRKQRRH